MAVPIEKFIQQLEDSGILAGDTIKDFIPPKASPKDATELALELVRKKKLTKFQAEEVSKGKGKSLVLGNYVLMEKIGAGGMGQVFKAEHRRMHRTVAIKMLPPNVTKDAAAIARFEREVTAAAKLRHPNIVAADDADCANGVHFLVMELVEGNDLSALVKKKGPFSVAQALNYLLQAAKGLEAAHKKGIVHRDIKPANLLLDKEGVVKILDMGLARLSLDGDDAPQADLTSTGTIMGTVDYMAPEQALDTKAADARADIYALGCSLFFLLTGKSTYEGDTLMKKLLAHRDQPIPALRTIRPEVSEQIEAVFKKLVAKKVEDRYQSMTEVIVELERCTAGPMTSVTSQQPATTTFEGGAFDFLKNLPEEPTILTKPQTKAVTGNTGSNKMLALIGAAVLGVLILAGIIVSLRTKDGTLVVEIDQPDAMVQVLNAEGKVEISQKGGKGLVTISVDPGKHRLKVEKEGFTVFGQDFEMKSGGETPIKAKLVPLDEKPAVVGTKPAPVPAGTKKPLFFQTPEFDPWAKKVASMPAEKQVEAVSKKLMELNPGFEGKVTGWDLIGTPFIENGVVTVFGFLTDNVTDISPVQGLVGLRMLCCSGSTSSLGKLVDLSPLQGMPLTELNIVYNQVVDLSPLHGIPLTTLNIGCNRVVDLSPLKRMPLTAIKAHSTQVADLSPLKDLRLRHLGIEGTQVTDLTPLKGMSLSQFQCDYTRVSDLSPLSGMPLRGITLNNTFVSDLSPLRGMPLKNLACDFKPERDTELLRSIKTLVTINDKPAAEFWKEVEEQQTGKKLGFQMPGFDQWVKEVAAMPAENQVEAVSKKLVELNPGFDGKLYGDSGAGTPSIHDGIVWNVHLLTNEVTDISPVRAFAGLSHLTCYGSDQQLGKLVDLTPLKDMKLVALDIRRNEASDLSPLKGLPLTSLNIQGTQVVELSPLQRMPLTGFFASYTNIVDLSPLQGMPLRHMQIEFTQVSDLSPLKGMPLTSIFAQNSQISDLSPLKGMSLTTLLVYETPVSDLSPLQGMQLTHLGCNETLVSDLSPLKELPLQQLDVHFTPDRDTALLRSIRTLQTINGKPAIEFYRAVEDYRAAARKPLAFEAPGFEQWTKETSALPAEEQVKAVVKKLQELNPGFDGKVAGWGADTPNIESGVVTGLTFLTDNVTDISPLRALGSLSALYIPGSDVGKGKLLNLSPLKGLPLRRLSVQFTQVSDLSPLQGMKLNYLHCSSTFVSDLSSLKGMKLEFLYCFGTRFRDISILNGMPLKELHTYLNVKRDAELLRSIKTLETINYKPVSEFWKEVEGKK